MRENDLLTKTFDSNITAYTYTGGKTGKVLKVFRYRLTLRQAEVSHSDDRGKVDPEVSDTSGSTSRTTSAKGKNIGIPKTEVMFVIKADTLETVKEGIRMDKHVQAKKLRAIQKIKDRPVVLTQACLKRGHQRDVRLVMRSGHVLRGRLVEYSRYTLILKIKGVLVLVYRHGVLEYSVTPSAE